MNKTTQKIHTDFLTVLLVFGIFAVSMIAVLMAGAGAYKRIAARDSEAYNIRICTQYIRTKLLRASSSEDIEIESLNAPGCGALKIKERAGEGEYITYIYSMDSYLCEMFIPAGQEPDYKNGERLTEGEITSLSIKDGVFRAELMTEDGNVGEVIFSLISKGEGEQNNEE